MILYLLPFSNKTHFKFGVTDVTKRGFERPYQELDPLYGIDFSSALMVTASKKEEILILETEIKKNYSRYFKASGFEGKEGASEVLPIEYFEAVRMFIQQKAQLVKWQGLKITSWPERILPSASLPQEKEKKPKPIKQRPTPKYSDSLIALDFFFHPYGKRIIDFAKKRIQDIRFYEVEMPGVFKFMRLFLSKSMVSQNIKNGFRSHDYLENSVKFYFEKSGAPLYVDFRLHENLLIDVNKSNDPRGWGISSFQLEGEPKEINLELLDEVKAPSEEEIEKDMMAELANARMLEEAAKYFSF